MKDKQKIKKKIVSIGKISKLTRVMKIISIMKFKKLIKKVQDSKELLTELKKTLGYFLGHKSFETSVQNVEKGTLWFVFGSDLGFCGSYNVQLLKLMKKNVKKEDELIVFGRRLINTLNSESIKTVWSGSTEKLTPETLEEVLDITTDGFGSKWTSYGIIYALVEHKSIKIISEKLFQQNQEHAVEQQADFSWETEEDELLARILKIALAILLPEIHVISRHAEETMRRNSLEKAAENAADLVDELKLKYNQLRQEQITQELIASRE